MSCAPRRRAGQGAGLATGYALVFLVLNVLLGVGFGLLFRNTPVAVVV